MNVCTVFLNYPRAINFPRLSLYCSEEIELEKSMASYTFHISEFSVEPSLQTLVDDSGKEGMLLYITPHARVVNSKFKSIAMN